MTVVISPESPFPNPPSLAANPFPITYAPPFMPMNDPLVAAVTPVALPVPSDSCGDGRLEENEECDDGNPFDLDGCSSFCLWERGTCGDGIVQALLGEQCEPSLPGEFPCLANCRYRLATCGDGVAGAGETCDEGARNGNDPAASCRPDCSPSRCGDLILSFNEQCEDGNRLPGDGCGPFCVLERTGAQITPGTLPANTISLPAERDGPVTNGTPQGTERGLTSVPANTNSGPGALALMAAGAAAGYAWIRRRRN